VAMALCWSVDNSIVLILFSAAAYFLFLGFYAKGPRSKSSGWKKTENFDKQTSSEKIVDLLKNIFSKREAGYSTLKKSFSQPKASSSAVRPMVPLIILAVFAAFFLFLVGSIFSSSDSDFESPDYFTRAEQQYSQGEYDSAYINYRRAWKDEGSAEAMVGYGNVLAYRQQYDSAVVMYDKAFVIDPEYLPAPYAKGAMFYNLQRYNEAIALMDPLLQENTDYYNGMLLMGDCYYALNQFDNAIVWYANAYEKGGMRSSALCHLMAYIYDTKGDNSKAIGLYQEALQYDSTIVDIYKRLGELLPNDDGNYYRTRAIRLGAQ
jgi:tetratricopeptide (TPR) repeat protein